MEYREMRRGGRQDDGAAPYSEQKLQYIKHSRDMSYEEKQEQMFQELVKRGKINYWMVRKELNDRLRGERPPQAGPRNDDYYGYQSHEDEMYGPPEDDSYEYEQDAGTTEEILQSIKNREDIPFDMKREMIFRELVRGGETDYWKVRSELSRLGMR